MPRYKAVSRYHGAALKHLNVVVDVKRWLQDSRWDDVGVMLWVGEGLEPKPVVTKTFERTLLVDVDVLSGPDLTGNAEDWTADAWNVLLWLKASLDVAGNRRGLGPMPLHRQPSG
jgi:hypothetical protein